MGVSRSRLVVEREMTDVSEFKTRVSLNGCDQRIYPTSLAEVCVLNGKTDSKRHVFNVMKPEGDGQSGTVDKAESLSSGSSSLSSREFPHYSQGLDALTTLKQSSSHLQSTPKSNGIHRRSKFGNGEAVDVSVGGNQGDSDVIVETSNTPDERYCNCDRTVNSSCEVIVETHESVISKKMLGPKTLRRSCSMSDAILLQTAKQKPKWKIEVEMESTRVIHGALKRDQDDSFVVSDTISSGDTKHIDTRDESTETDGIENGDFVLFEGEGEDSGHRDHERSLEVTSVDNTADEQKKKKTFWAKKKKRKHLHDKEKSQSLPENGGTLRNLNFWPFWKGSNSGNHVLSSSPRQNLRQSLFEEKLKYLHIAARVSCPRAADVRVTLLVEIPSDVKLTNAQVSTKTYLLSVTLNAFFYPYPKVYVEWVDSLSDIIQERMKVGDIMPKFVTSDVSNCKVCLILSPDASVLLCKPNCALIPDLANIAGYSRRSTFVMEATDERHQVQIDSVTSSELPTTSEKFAPIYEIEEFDEEGRNVNGAQTL